MSPDWNSDPDPVPYADFSNPQSLNLYSYALINPLRSADADGHVTCDPDTWDNATNTLTAGACHYDFGDFMNSVGQIAQQATNALSNAAQHVSSFVNAPRDAGCMNAATAAGAAAGAAQGAWAGAGISGAGGAIVAAPTGELAGVLTVPGGAAGGAALGGFAGGVAGGLGGRALGWAMCASGGGGGAAVEVVGVEGVLLRRRN